MNEMCYCQINDHTLTKAGSMPMGPHGPKQEGQMAARCEDDWGFGFLIGFGVLAAGYAGGGVYVGTRQNGQDGRPLVEQHPHYTQIVEVGALAKDGLQFARARVQGQAAAPNGAGLREPLGEAKERRRKPKHGDEERQTTEGADAAQAGAAPARAALEASEKESAQASVAAGDGGRWVRVPD